jgi:ubiquinone/menaquinone biosynthesis C-methylase UbiE
MPGKIADAIYGPLFARVYERMNARSEEGGFRDKRKELTARARGRTLEVGAGTGLNVEHYPDAVTELVLTEPDEHMRAQIEQKVTGGGRRIEVVAAGAEELPFPDASFDTVLATLVFCTVDDAGAGLREVARVLKPDGQFLFIEHVRADDPKLARWQDRLDKPWSWCGRGCHPNRDTLAEIDRAGLEVTQVEHDGLQTAPTLVRPIVIGEAHRTTT